MPIRIVIAEDDLLVREGLVRLIEALPGLELLAACADYDSLLQAVAAEEPDVVVTDIRMPPTRTDEGLRAAEWLRQNRPRVGVVVLSQHVAPEYAIALLENGATGRAYLVKERVGDPDELVRAITEVARGGSVVDSRVVEGLARARGRHPSPLDDLTPRELEVLEKLAQGLSNSAIATASFLSERSVEKNISAIFSKLGLSEEGDVHRRVKATLLFLADQSREAH